MLTIPEASLVYLNLEPTDMRKSIDSLCVMVVEVLKQNPQSGHIFLFRNRYGDKLKALVYEQNCFSLWYRRLEKGKYIFPRNVEGVIELDKDHFAWLLASDKYSRWDALQQQPYQTYF